MSKLKENLLRAWRTAQRSIAFGQWQYAFELRERMNAEYQEMFGTGEVLHPYTEVQVGSKGVTGVVRNVSKQSDGSIFATVVITESNMTERFEKPSLKDSLTSEQRDNYWELSSSEQFGLLVNLWINHAPVQAKISYEVGEIYHLNVDSLTKIKDPEKGQDPLEVCARKYNLKEIAQKKLKDAQRLVDVLP